MAIETETVLTHRVFTEIGGTLRLFERDGFDEGFPTVDDAVQALQNDKNMEWNDYIILPVVTVRPKP